MDLVPDVFRHGRFGADWESKIRTRYIYIYLLDSRGGCQKDCPNDPQDQTSIFSQS